ncbi:MAG: hypothetical protein IPL52_12110 [Flavobacteriales bacterium]|nr:hypothetical protein [Flavobacteriales bacterium]
MDAHRRLKEDEADKALRELFVAAGRVEAPSSIDVRILQRIALAPKPITPEPELLPKWVWIAAAIAFCGLAAFLFATSPAATGPSYTDKLLQSVPEFSLERVFTSPWLMMTVLTIGVLMALDVFLARGRARFSLL